MKKIDSNKVIIEKMKQLDIDLAKSLETEQGIDIISKRNFKNDLDNMNNHYFIAKYNNEIIGYAGSAFSLDFVDILSIVVKKDFKRNKVGSLLLKHIIDLSLEKKIDSIFLEVRASNISAQKLYEHFNFIKISERPKYYKDNLEDAYIYLRQFPSSLM